MGRETATAWEAPASSTIVAPARFAPKRSTSGLLAWSASATRAQDGLVFHVAADAGAVNDEATSGRWDTASAWVTGAGTSAAKMPGNASAWMVTSTASPRPRPGTSTP